MEQAALIEQLRERIQELEARLAQDSHNSSKPPSSDPPFQKPPPRSQRQPSGCQPGGQSGRRGVTRRLVEDPDQRVIIPLTGTCACGRAVRRLPLRCCREVVIQRAVTEYRIAGGTCTCGRVQRSAFPEGVTATVQYGPGVLALAVYLTQSQLLPYQRTAELFQELAGIALSPGTPPARRHLAATHLKAPVAAIRGAFLTAPVHNHWSAYARYQCLHAFCNAHRLAN